MCGMGRVIKKALCTLRLIAARLFDDICPFAPPLLIDGRQYLFYTDEGNAWNRARFHKIFQYIKHRAKVTRPGGLHVFGRHTPATLMTAHGADIRVVQTIMRHNDIKTTLRYAHVSDTTKRTMYDKFLTI